MNEPENRSNKDRRSEKKFSGAKKQWDEYLDALPCTLCKKAAAECDCKSL